MAYFERTDGSPSLFFRERGEGPPMILFNGLSQSTANWTSQIAALSEHYRVIAWDSRGQGRSALGDEPLDIDVHVRDAVALLDHLDVAESHLVGFSHGARVALRLAATHPERSQSVTLTSIGSDDSAYRNLILRVWREVLALGGLEAMAWVTTTHILGEEFLEAHADQVDVMIRTVQQRNDETAMKQLLASLADYPPSLDDAARVRCPSSLLTSTNDPLVSGASADRLAAALEPRRRWTFDDCGHTIPVERSDRWRGYVLEFLDELS